MRNTAVPQQVRTPGELALQYGMVVLTGAAAFAFCLWFGRGNYLAYTLVFWALSLRTALAELFGNDLLPRRSTKPALLPRNRP